MSKVAKLPAKSASTIMETMGNLPPVIPFTPTQLEPGTAEVVNALFRELQAIFPAWKQAWPDAETLATAKRSWIKAFMAEGITRIEQIRYGIQNCRKLGGDFAPSVGKFIKWCQPTPEMLGIPSHDKAFREALENSHPSRATSRTWSHPAVRHTALQCELHNLADLPSERASKIFDRAYDITIRMLVQGQPLEEIAVGIGYDGQKTELELAIEEGERFVHATIRRQGIPSDGQAARVALLAKFGKGVCP
ncbi:MULTISPECIES: replication protein P [unclassified Pseudomonas]|uniref:replication protein P n=1 Tax=unclassified Pseudomonas TaxID=196821 RepID=UPI0025D3051E|nr:MULTISPECIES: replication protein P [unclassified Pseudomonas]